MGRGRGGYTGKQIWYLDSGGKKVKDRGAISVAEFYMDLGFESVFRREHNPGKSYDSNFPVENRPQSLMR